MKTHLAGVALMIVAGIAASLFQSAAHPLAPMILPFRIGQGLCLLGLGLCFVRRRRNNQS